MTGPATGTRAGGPPSALYGALEIAFNRYLALEPEALAECGRLAGRIIALRAIGPDWEFFIAPHAGGVQVLDAAPGKPDVRVAAPPAQLLRRLLRGPAAGVQVQVEGDAALLARFSQVLASVGFDPEEWLARWVGDGAAHRVNEALQALLGWSRSTASTLALDTAEYLREETRDLVHRADVEHWSDAVTALRDRAAYLDTRLSRLEARMSSRPPGAAGERP